MTTPPLKFSHVGGMKHISAYLNIHRQRVERAIPKWYFALFAFLFLLYPAFSVSAQASPFPPSLFYNLSFEAVAEQQSTYARCLTDNISDGSCLDSTVVSTDSLGLKYWSRLGFSNSSSGWGDTSGSTSYIVTSSERMWVLAQHINGDNYLRTSNPSGFSCQGAPVSGSSFVHDGVTLEWYTFNCAFPNLSAEAFYVSALDYASNSRLYMQIVTEEDMPSFVNSSASLVEMYDYINGDQLFPPSPIGSDLVLQPDEWIRINYPDQGDITSSTTFTVDIDYLLPPERAHLEFLQFEACSQVEQLTGIPPCEEFVINTSDLVVGTQTNITKSITLDYDGAYLGAAYFWNGVSEALECSWWAVWCEDEAVETFGTDTTSFVSASTTVMLQIPYYRESLFNQCDQLVVGAGAICTAMVWLFVPSDDVFIRATDQMWASMSQKIPFGFFMYAQDQLGAIVNDSSASSSFDGITVDLDVLGGVTPVFDVSAIKNDEFYNRLIDTIDPYAGIFIWFFFLAYVWHRMKGTEFTPPEENNLWGV